MIAACRTCGQLFETATENASIPGDAQCPACYRAERGEPAPTYHTITGVDAYGRVIHAEVDGWELKDIVIVDPTLTDVQRDWALYALEIRGYDLEMIAAEWNDHDIASCMEAHGFDWHADVEEWLDANGHGVDYVGGDDSVNK